MVLDQEMLKTKSFFLTQHVHMSDLWLESCVNWFREEHSEERYTQNELQNEVYEQWLLLDLKEAELPVLPPNLSEHKLIMLNDHYCLQIESIIDIARPRYWQLQKIRNSNTLTSLINQDKDITDTKRMLQMTLTDGVQEIHAIEHSPIPSISIKLKPGTKMKIIGPVAVRRGKIMLEAKNVKLLGGEVEEMFVSHATENILARSLGIQENPNPYLAEIEEAATVEVQPHITNYLRPSVSSTNTLMNSRPSTSTHLLINDMSEEEERRLADEMDNLIEMERDITSNTNKKLSKADVAIEDFDDSGFNKFESAGGNRANSTEINTNSNTVINISDSLDSDSDDIFNSIDLDEHLKEVEETFSANKLYSAKEILEKKKLKKEGSFKIKAKFHSILGKLSLEEGFWSLKIAVEDSAMNELPIKVHSDVISKLLGYTPMEVASLKNSTSAGNEAKQEILKVIQCT